MTTSNHCTLRTFRLGFVDWLRTRVSMTHAEALREARDEIGGSLSKKTFRTAAIVIAAIGLVGLVAALATPALVKGAVAAGATSEHVAVASQWGTSFVLGGLAGYLIVSKVLRLRRFCFEMCARGRTIEEARTQAQP